MEDGHLSASILDALNSARKSRKWGPPLRALFPYLLELASGQKEEDVETELAQLAEDLPEATEHLRQKSENWLSFFRHLEHIGCGDVIVGRRGFQTRFRWAFKPSRLADAQALVEWESQDERSPAIESRAIASDLAKLHADNHLYHMGNLSKKQRINEQVHPFPLRHDWIVNISVPADVTREELVRLAEFIRLLPTR